MRPQALALIVGTHWRSGRAGSCANMAIRSRPGRVEAASSEGPRRGGRRQRRRLTAPCITSSSSALSADRCGPARRIRGHAPASASVQRLGRDPARESASSPPARSRRAGIRIEPPPSEPVAARHHPGGARPPRSRPTSPRVSATGSQGLRVTPLASLAVHGQIVSSGTLVIPIGIAPAARSRPHRLGVGYRLGGPRNAEPLVAGPDRPPAMSSLTAIGTPASGPLPLESAAARASSPIVHPKRVQPRIEVLDPPQAQLDQFSRVNLPRLHQLRDRRRAVE